MARQPRDLADYVDGDTEDEDASLFFPTGEGGLPDLWTLFFGGILIGVAGGALIPLAPWLGGSMVLVGYGMTALSLRGSRNNRFARALCLGFGIMALAGAALLLGSIFFPDLTWYAVGALAERRLVFLSVAFAAWGIGFLRYFFGVLAR